jgi:hypothetical protein
MKSTVHVPDIWRYINAFIIIIIITCWQLSAGVLDLGACAVKQNGDAKHACFIDIYFFVK